MLKVNQTEGTCKHLPQLYKPRTRFKDLRDCKKTQSFWKHSRVSESNICVFFLLKQTNKKPNKQHQQLLIHSAFFHFQFILLMLPLLDGQKGTDVVHQGPQFGTMRGLVCSCASEESYQQPRKSNQPPFFRGLRASSIFEVGIYHPK